MLQAPGLEEPSDDELSVVSYEETAEETRQRKLLKKQLQRRERDKALLREQSRKRIQKEKDLVNKLKAAKEEDERRRLARWGVLPVSDAAKAGAAPRIQDLPRDLAEVSHPSSWANYPKKRLGEPEYMNASVKTPVCFGYRAEFEEASKEYRVPLPSALIRCHSIWL